MLLEQPGFPFQATVPQKFGKRKDNLGKSVFSTQHSLVGVKKKKAHIGILQLCMINQTPCHIYRTSYPKVLANHRYFSVVVDAQSQSNEDDTYPAQAMENPPIGGGKRLSW